MDAKLLSRAEFRDVVFERDGRCVACGSQGQDAHHLVERRLFTDSCEQGGYFADNGVVVCGVCHLRAESTEYSPEFLRDAAGITTTIVPSHLYPDQPYTKWGDPVLTNGTRMRGELFFDPSVQRVIAPFLDLYTSRVKYPRTYHLPWSESISDDDRVMASLAAFEGNDVVVTEKLDGENTTMYRDYIHARSLDDSRYAYRDWVKNLWGQIAHDIPEGWRISGENLYAAHSVKYDDLASYFAGFSVWDERNTCLSWADTCEWLDLLGLATVPVLYEGAWDEAAVRGLWRSGDERRKEGYVVRVAGEFTYRDFRHSAGKFVRAGHASTVKHWFHGQAWIKNELRRETSTTI